MPRFGSGHRHRGGVPVAISITNQSIYKSGLSPQLASYNAESDGQITKNGAATFLENWINLPSYVANYEIRATFVSGDALDSGTLATWLGLGTTRTWSLTALGETKTCTLTIEIRDVATSTIQDTATVSITASGA